MDIGSKAKYPANALSNFAPHHFELHGIPINSMEGLLQSFKFKDANMQKEICLLVGIGAKRAGSKKKWQRDQMLHWQGVEYPRKSAEYQQLLDDAFQALFTQNEKARKALLATHKAVLKHSIGRSKKEETVLTRQEFCSRLTTIRNRLRVENEFIDVFD